jgi:hypothetical protein
MNVSVATISGWWLRQDGWRASWWLLIWELISVAGSEGWVWDSFLEEGSLTYIYSWKPHKLWERTRKLSEARDMLWAHGIRWYKWYKCCSRWCFMQSSSWVHAVPNVKDYQACIGWNCRLQAVKVVSRASLFTLQMQRDPGFSKHQGQQLPGVGGSLQTLLHSKAIGMAKNCHTLTSPESSGIQKFCRAGKLLNLL